MIGQNHATEVEAGTVFTLQQSLGALLGENYEVIASMTGADKDNYELVAYDDGNGNMIYGTLTIVAAHDVQFDGSCACGTSHLTETLTFTNDEPGQKSSVISCPSGYEGGIYKIELDGGRYSVCGSDNFFYGDVYNENGEIVGDVGDIFSFTVPAGTYYIHIGCASDPYSDSIWVAKGDCLVANINYDGSCLCGNSHLTETLTFTGGEDVGKSATIDCDFTYEGGIYKIALEGGEYEFFGSDQFFNISGIYDVNGNKLAGSIGTYILPKGTYYFHVYVGSNPSSDTIWVKKTAKMLDAATMANAIVPDMEPDNSDAGVRIHNLQTHNGGDTFVLFYNAGDDTNALGKQINFRYEDGGDGYSAPSNIESIEFYDVNGIQLDVTYDEPDMNAASGVTAVGGVYIVVTMNGEGMDNLYFYAV